MKYVYVAVFAVALIFAGVVEAAPDAANGAEAAKVPAPFAVPLDLVLKNEDGTPMKNPNQQRVGLRVLGEFTFGGKTYAAGDEVTDMGEAARIAAFLDSKKEPYKVGSLDPKCEKCDVVTVRFVVSQALAKGRPCAASSNGAASEKDPACTAEEEKAEKDPLEMWSRFEEAKRISKAASPLTMDTGHLTLIQKLVASLYRNDPLIVSQVYPALGVPEPKAWQ